MKTAASIVLFFFFCFYSVWYNTLLFYTRFRTDLFCIHVCIQYMWYDMTWFIFFLGFGNIIRLKCYFCVLFYSFLVLLFVKIHSNLIDCKKLLEILHFTQLFPMFENSNQISKLQFYIHTYIIDHYNPSVRIIDLVSHTTYVVCVNFIHKWRDLQFKVDSELQIF